MGNMDFAAYMNHDPAFLHRRTIVQILYKEFDIVARFSDSTEYLEGVLQLAEEDRAQTTAAHAMVDGLTAALKEIHDKTGFTPMEVVRNLVNTFDPDGVLVPEDVKIHLV